MTIGYAGAQQMIISAAYYTIGRPLGKPRWIFIHGTASGTGYTAQETARDFGSPGWQANRHASTHYVIGYNGDIVQCVGEEHTAWGNGIISGPPGRAPIGGGDPHAAHDAWWDTTAKRSVNEYSISIEHSKSQDNSSELSPEQEAASFKLINDICNRWGIPRHYGDASGGIIGHYSVDPINRSFCPGTYPWQRLFTYLGDPNNWGPTQPVPVTGGNPTEPTLPTEPVSEPVGSFSHQPVIINSLNNAYLSLSDQTHDILQSTPGFYGWISALDEGEQFPGIYNAWTGDSNPVDAAENSVMSILGTVNGNMNALLLRSIIVLTGVFLLLALLMKTRYPLLEGGSSSDQ